MSQHCNSLIFVKILIQKNKNKIYFAVFINDLLVKLGRKIVKGTSILYFYGTIFMKVI